MRFVRFAELKPEYGIPYTRAWIDQMIARGEFPPKTHLSANVVGWWDSILAAWLKERAEKGTEAT